MLSLRSLVSLASVALVALAQNPRIAFSSIPAVAQAGQSYNITWGGGDGVTPVTLTLRRGDPNNLETVGVIADRVRGYSCNWEVSTLLATGDDYALQITQGQGEINYSGSFAIVGGTGSVTLSYSGLTTTTTNSSTSTTSMSSMTITGAGTGISMGTGSALPRNTTFSTPSLTAPSTTTTSHATTTSATEATTTTPNAATSLGGSAALAMGLFGAIMFMQ